VLLPCIFPTFTGKRQRYPDPDVLDRNGRNLEHFIMSLKAYQRHICCRSYHFQRFNIDNVKSTSIVMYVVALGGQARFASMAPKMAYAGLWSKKVLEWNWHTKELVWTLLSSLDLWPRISQKDFPDQIESELLNVWSLLGNFLCLKMAFKESVTSRIDYGCCTRLSVRIASWPQLLSGQRW